MKMMMAAVMHAGYALCDASAELRADREIVARPVAATERCDPCAQWNIAQAARMTVG